MDKEFEPSFVDKVDKNEEKDYPVNDVKFSNNSSPLMTLNTKIKGLFDLSSESSRVGLDIGSRFIKLVHMRKNKILNILIEKKDEIEDIRIFFDKIDNNKTKVFTSVGDSSIVVKQIEIPVTAKKKLESVLQWEVPLHVPYPVDEVVINWQIMGTGSDNSKMKVLIVAVKNELKKRHLDFLSSLNIEPHSVSVEPLALMNSFLLTEPLLEKRERIVMLDMGATNTILNIVQGKTDFFTRYLSMGGDYLTAEIQKRTGLNYEEAEAMKKKDDSSLFDILESSFFLFVQNLRKSLAYYNSESGRIEFERVIICGGGSGLSSLRQYISEHMGVAVELFNPVVGTGKDEHLSQYYEKIGSQCALAFGLAVKEG